MKQKYKVWTVVDKKGNPWTVFLEKMQALADKKKFKVRGEKVVPATLIIDK